MVSLSETLLNDSMNNMLLNIPGYTCIRQDRTWMENNVVKKGGGLCCYGKENTQLAYVEFVDFNVSSKNI